MIRVGIVIYPHFQLINLAVVTAFEYANQSFDTPVYDITLLSEFGGPVPTSSAVSVHTEPFGSARYDTILALGDNDAGVGSEALLSFLRKSASRTRRIGGPCTGAFNLAGAGLLEGKRATTHWYYAVKMRQDHPNVKLMEDKIFINDGGIWTSAGATACIDMSLAFIEEDLGAEVAKLTAKKLVVYYRRMGGQSQHSALLDLAPRTDRIQKALVYARTHLTEDLSVERLAELVHLSERQFARAFAEETGSTPAKAIERLRIEAARLMIETSNVSLDSVAKDTGFGDPDRMRRAFLRIYGQSPQVIRRVSRLVA
jgi:transcriptional regulator GlxA family with amidase domain